MLCSCKRLVGLLLAIILALLIAVAIGLWCRGTRNFSGSAALGGHSGKAQLPQEEFLPTGKGNVSPESLTRYSQNISGSPAVLPGDKLAAALYECAQKMVLSTLPEGSTLTALPGGKTELQLLDPHTALISGGAVIPGSSRKLEQQLRYQIKVYFLADGSCEAAFPEFTRIH